MWIFTIFCVLGAVVGLCRVVAEIKQIRLAQVELVRIRSNPTLPAKIDLANAPIRLSRNNWAEFEGRIENLKQVIVVADIVEKPDSKLHEAVIHNFSRGVHYSFVVSKSKAVSELHGYLDIFAALATIAIKQHDLSQTIEDLVSIEALPDDWNSVPLVFYRVQDTAEQGTPNAPLKTLAFWGDKSNVGIADTYQALPAPVSDALAIALMSGAPIPVRQALANLENDNFERGESLLGEVRALSI
jgi:bifunctional DNase/RNase